MAPKGFEELIQWLGYQLLKDGSLHKRGDARELRAPQKRIPVLGVTDSGMSTFFAAVAQ
ncbi:MAG: hypothetical protein ACTSWN_07135 [Promethearchaeota archaeon]